MKNPTTKKVLNKVKEYSEPVVVLASGTWENTQGERFGVYKVPICRVEEKHELFVHYFSWFNLETRTRPCEDATIEVFPAADYPNKQIFSL